MLQHQMDLFREEKGMQLIAFRHGKPPVHSAYEPRWGGGEASNQGKREWREGEARATQLCCSIEFFLWSCVLSRLPARPPQAPAPSIDPQAECVSLKFQLAFIKTTNLSPSSGGWRVKWASELQLRHQQSWVPCAGSGRLFSLLFPLASLGL